MLTSKQVIRRKEQINKKTDALNKAREKLQEECPHHNLRYKNSGSTGNYDRDDSYWRDWFCPDCEKRWTTSQSLESKKQYPHAREISFWHNRTEYENFYKVK